MSSSILKYCRPINHTLPSPSGQLSLTIPSQAIAAANTEVGGKAAGTQCTRKKRGSYHKYTPKQRAEIARYAKVHGVVAARRVYGKKLGITINECTIRNFKKAYNEEVLKKQASSGSCSPVKELQTMQRGRPVLLGEKLDTIVKNYILAVRDHGGTIDTSVVISAANGIVKSLQRTQLVQYKGHVELSNSWARSLLKRMNFTKRKGTTKSSMPPEAFAQLKMQFLQDIITVVEMEEIPPDLINNWDQTGLHVVPASSWTHSLY